jgi:hypothetical protein
MEKKPLFQESLLVLSKYNPLEENKIFEQAIQEKSSFMSSNVSSKKR